MTLQTRPTWDLDRDESFNRLQGLNAEIVRLQERLTEQRERQRSAKATYEQMKARITLDVIQETKPGTDKALYGNPESRDAAIMRRLYNDDTATKAQRDIDILNNDIAELTVKLEEQTRQRSDFLALLGYGAAWLNFNRPIVTG